MDPAPTVWVPAAFIAVRSAASLGRQTRLFRSWVVRSCFAVVPNVAPRNVTSLSAGRIRCLVPAESRMPMPRRQSGGGDDAGWRSLLAAIPSRAACRRSCRFQHLPEDPHILEVAHRASRLLSDPELSMQFWSYYR